MLWHRSTGVAQLCITLQKLIVQFEGFGKHADAGLRRLTPRQGRGFRAKGSKSPKGSKPPKRSKAPKGSDAPPALSQFPAVIQSIVATMDLEHGIRYGAQLQTAKVFVVALEQTLMQMSATGGLHSSRAGAAPRILTRLTKKEMLALGSLAKSGLVGPGAVDPSPQRTTIAVAAVITILTNTSSH